MMPLLLQYSLQAVLASSISIGALAPVEPDPAPETTIEQAEPAVDVSKYADARALLDALSVNDQTTNSMTGTVRFTTINALENDRQTRTGDLLIARKPDGSGRNYAVKFKTLEIDDRRENIAEHYIFDGRWLVERLPEDKQFNKRELVPAGKTLDPMELMRDAPFWVSVGSDQDRLLASYNAQLLEPSLGLIDNEDFPELASLADKPYIESAIQLELEPKPGSKFEDDWEKVRIWFNAETLEPVLYIKAEWTGDLQIVELFGVKTNTEIPESVFDTTSPGERSGWNIQVSTWRGQE